MFWMLLIVVTQIAQQQSFALITGQLFEHGLGL